MLFQAAIFTNLKEDVMKFYEQHPKAKNTS